LTVGAAHLGQDATWDVLLIGPWVVDVLLFFPALFSVGRRVRLALIAGLYVALNVVLPAYLGLRFLQMGPLEVGVFLVVYRALDLEATGMRKLFVALWTSPRPTGSVS
jgi:hypothetical protein